MPSPTNNAAVFKPALAAFSANQLPTTLPYPSFNQLTQQSNPYSFQPAISTVAKADRIKQLEKLVMQQTAKGFWNLTLEFAQNLQLPSVDKLQSSSPCPPDAAWQKVWATAIALAFLESYLQNKREDWAMMASKSKQWLVNELRTVNSKFTAESLIDKAKATLQQLLP